MKSQVELLSLQREQLSQSLSRAESEKAPILLPLSAQKRKRSAEPGRGPSTNGGESSGSALVGAQVGAAVGGAGSLQSNLPGAHVGEGGGEEAGGGLRREG